MKRTSSSDDIPPIHRFLYIDDGYRANHGFKDALHSLFYFHNETMNIYTHFIGFICIVILGINFFLDYFALNHLDTQELIALEIYIICSAGCLLFSTIYHLFGCVSETVHNNLLRLDLTGVAFLVAGSFIPGAYFGFHCVPDIRNIHLVVSGFVLLVGLIAPWIEYKICGIYIRPYILASLVVVGLYPLFDWLRLTPLIYREALFWGFISMIALYAIGFTIFVCRFPEILFPKNFFATQMFSSHTLWHICVLASIFIWYRHIMLYQSLIATIGCTPYETMGLFVEYVGFDLSNLRNILIFVINLVDESA